ncbi:MAG TPA: TetR/AcrR family transcriptional regulator [Dehalococcoidia bacterium]|nr:TetR/AcrR family transcriptional regulator [Dehalococcoidia bacterium]
MTQSLVRPGRRVERSAQIRADLLAAAERLLAQKGIDRTTISDITSEAGLGFGTFYNYFASKEDLYQELVRNALQMLVERIDTRCASTPDHYERLRVIAEEGADFAADHSDLFVLLTTNPDVHEATHEGVEELAASLKGWLRKGFADGVFQAVDPNIVVKAIIGMYAFVLRPLARDASRREEIKDALIRLIQGAVIGIHHQVPPAPGVKGAGQ